MPATRAADDFDTIRARIDELRKEQENAQKNTPQQTNATEQDPGANYDYGCAANTSTDKLLALSEACVGLIVRQYYTDVLLDENDNEVKYPLSGPIARVLP